jgi:hypothetical protein
MLFKKKTHQAALNFHEMTPFRVREHVLEENGLASIVVPKFKNEFLTHFLVPRRKPKVIKVKLDAMGTAIWLELDGTSNVGQILDRLKENTMPEASSDYFEARALQFLRVLHKQGHIGFREL